MNGQNKQVQEQKNYDTHKVSVKMRNQHFCVSRKNFKNFKNYDKLLTKCIFSG